jgi:peptidoglycan/xylan/chitin deacetylase (PgdA/CDA1 family)
VRYLVKNPGWLRWIYPSYTWSVKTPEKRIYLTFDDGPHPVATSFVLDELRKHSARATFFCLGKNVAAYPEVFRSIRSEGHAVGNHTHDHLNGWTTDDATYLENIATANHHIAASLFRPPYGRLTRSQAKQVQRELGLKIVMWSVFSGDSDPRLSPEKCWDNVRGASGKGSIVVFHDGSASHERLRYALPRTLDHWSKQGFTFETLG